MDIRTRLTVQFVILVSVLLAAAMSAIYFFSDQFRKEEFFQRLENKCNNLVQLLFEVDEINSNLLKQIEKANPINLPDEEISVYDDHGKLIFQKQIKQQPENHIHWLSKLRGDSSFSVEQNRIQILGFQKGVNGRIFYIIASATDTFGYSKLRNLRTVLMVTFGICIIILWFLGRYFANRAFRPVKNMVNQVQNMNIQDLNKRLTIDNTHDEIGQLGTTFNDLLGRVESTWVTQKNFIANASHELRTPLTAISGQLEVELMQNRSKEEYRSTLESVHEDIQTMNEICNNLLILAHTSADNPRSQFRSVRIDEPLWQARNEQIRRFPDSRVHITISDDMDDDAYFTIDGSEKLLRIAFLNIIDNACKYSADKAVEILLGRSGQNCIIWFTDKGIGIPRDEIRHIFEPFYRSHKVIHTKGHGIGLSLVDKIIQIHDGRVEVKSSSKGTVFRIELPMLG